MCCYLPLPGVVYQVLHYLLGLRALGYDAYYVEDSVRWVYDLDRDDLNRDATHNVGVVARALAAHGFADRWAFRGAYDGGRCYGMEDAAIGRLYRDADALLNVTGQDLRDAQLTCARRIYVESDPFATQVRIAQGDERERARVAAHDTLFTFGENIGAPDCRIPESGFRWLPTRQPVAPELWGASAESARPGDRYTTVTSWISHVQSIVHEGEAYHWQKHLEFEKILDLPRRRAVSFELASKVLPDVRRRLCEHGWRHVPSDPISADMDRYRAYIQGSRAELTVARDQYVRPRTGWFSDRSACYLAAGRPVITQDTGFGAFLPVGRGLFAFNGMDDILGAVDAIESDYAGHSRAAAEIARECFGADRVVASLMERAAL